MFLNILISAILGILSGLGVGGGTLLMLWLTVIQKVDFQAAKLTNLLFFLASAGVSTIRNIKSSRISLAETLPAAIAGCIVSFFVSLLTNNNPSDWLYKLFGVLLLAAAFREIRLGMQKQPE